MMFLPRFILRLDDFTSRYDKASWNRLEHLLDKYSIKPLVGVIPNCEDPTFLVYDHDPNYWDIIKAWMKKDWVIAMHGYTHSYITKAGGINPIHQRSEFAEVALDDQKRKIREGIAVFRTQRIEPQVFFAPSHTFDDNTLRALFEESNIRIISDTVAYDVYEYKGFTFVPQQSGAVRFLPFKTVTFCYHPNSMDERSFLKLECFFRKYGNHFHTFPLKETKRQFSIMDRVLRKAYFSGR